MLYQIKTATELELNNSQKAKRFRGIDSSVLVAIVGIAGTGLGALISGLLKIAALKQGSHIEIKGKDWSVRVPIDISDNKLNQLIKLAKSKDVDQIILNK